MTTPVENRIELNEKPSAYPTWFGVALLVVCVLFVFHRLFGAGFSGLDDDIHVYANPYLNPPTLASLGILWQKPYEGLYVPLAYTLFAAIAHFAQIPQTFQPDLGQVVTVDPRPFHVVSFVLHAANAILVFFFLRRLTKNGDISLICALFFAIHPLQIESVAWIAELRGLSGSFFALIALNLFMFARSPSEANPKRTELYLGLATFAFVCGMLCKPNIVVLPLVTLAIDRIVFGTDIRKSLILCGAWLVCAAPFLWITHAIQAIEPAGQSAIWQRPFIAGDALAFYLWKILVPIDLGVDYGRTPQSLFTHWWAYVTWIAPAALFLIAFKVRRSRPLIFLGALIFVIFFLPVLGLVPFTFQKYSTVADRYAYLPLLGFSLVLTELFDYVKERPRLRLPAWFFSFYFFFFMQAQTYIQYWLTPQAFLTQTLKINPNASFAYDREGVIAYGSQNIPAALQDFLASQRVAPGKASTDINIAACYLAERNVDQARAMLWQASSEPNIAATDWSKMGRLYMDMRDIDTGLKALAKAASLAPDDPTCQFNFARGLLSAQMFTQAVPVLQQCVQLTPSNAATRVALGVALAQTGHLGDAQSQLNQALQLDPSNPDAQRFSAQVQQLLSRGPALQGR